MGRKLTHTPSPWNKYREHNSVGRGAASAVAARHLYSLLPLSLEEAKPNTTTYLYFRIFPKPKPDTYRADSGTPTNRGERKARKSVRSARSANAGLHFVKRKLSSFSALYCLLCVIYVQGSGGPRTATANGCPSRSASARTSACVTSRTTRCFRARRTW